MRSRSMILAALLAASLAPSALAQTTSAPSFTIPPADVASSYCIYGGLLYSIGSVVGIGEGGPPLSLRCAENRQWQPLPPAAPPAAAPPRR